MIGLMVVILMVFYTCGELVLTRVIPMLRNGQKQPPEVFYKKGLEILQNSLENTCAQRSIFLWILRNF